METPLISVVMSVYNEPLDWLRQSIDSILQQTYSSFEFIIICDNPNYIEGIKVLNEYCRKDNRIRLIFNVENLGLTKSLNIGLRAAKGDYIARMDADDISKPRRFEKQMNYMKSNPDCMVCGTRIEYIGNVKWWKMPQTDWIKIEDEEIKGRMIFSSSFAHSSVMMRKTHPQVLYDENYRRSQDYELWTRLASTCVFHNLPQKLLCYRVSPDQISAKSVNNYSRDIRKKYLGEKLRLSGILDCDSNDLDLDFLFENLSLIKGNKLLTNSERNNIVQLLYFSRENDGLLTFAKCVFSGDFFKFPFNVKYRYMMTVFGFRKRLIV